MQFDITSYQILIKNIVTKIREEIPTKTYTTIHGWGSEEDDTGERERRQSGGGETDH